MIMKRALLCILGVSFICAIMSVSAQNQDIRRGGTGGGTTPTEVTNIVSAMYTNLPNVTVTNAAVFVQRTLTYSTTNVTVNLASGNVFLLTLTNNTTYLPQPSNIKAGQTFYIHVVQDGTGGRALAYDTNYWKFSSNSIPTISTNANAWDILSGVGGPYGTNVAVVWSPRFR